jgi:hypothetical protein
MTTIDNHSTTKCSHCAETEAARAAAVAEAAALREAADQLLWSIPGSNEAKARGQKLAALIDDPSPAVAALERRLARLGARSKQLDSIGAMLTAVGIIKGDDEKKPMGEPSRVAIALNRMEHAEARAELVPEPSLLRGLANCTDIWLETLEIDISAARFKKAANELDAARALAARIEAARGQEDGEWEKAAMAAQAWQVRQRQGGT